MALTIPIIEEAIVELLTNPATILAGHSDTNRLQAATDLEAINPGVYVGKRPQASSRNIAITIERAGGLTQVNADSFAGSERVLIDLVAWGRAGANRASLRTILEMGKLAEIVLVGFRGTVEGVEITCIEVENDPFQADEPPNDGSDDWVSGYTYPYQVDFTPITASHRIAEV